jgi:hypothetical protein
VDAIDTARKKVEEVGDTSALQKTEMGLSMRRIAAFRDTEGNIPGFHEVRPIEYLRIVIGIVVDAMSSAGHLPRRNRNKAKRGHLFRDVPFSIRFFEVLVRARPQRLWSRNCSGITSLRPQFPYSTVITAVARAFSLPSLRLPGVEFSLPILEDGG